MTVFPLYSDEIRIKSRPVFVLPCFPLTNYEVQMLAFIIGVRAPSGLPGTGSLMCVSLFFVRTAPGVVLFIFSPPVCPSRLAQVGTGASEQRANFFDDWSETGLVLFVKCWRKDENGKTNAC